MDIDIVDIGLVTEWGVYQFDGIEDVHVCPIDDYREHEFSEKCWCNPERDDEERNVLCHKSMDQREKYETGEVRLN